MAGNKVNEEGTEGTAGTKGAKGTKGTLARASKLLRAQDASPRGMRGMQGMQVGVVTDGRGVGKNPGWDIAPLVPGPRAPLAFAPTPQDLPSAAPTPGPDGTIQQEEC